MSETSAAPARQRRASREAVRGRIMVAARREFAAHGFDGVSLDQIAEAAGFSKGAVYSNFANKNDLFLALMEESVGTRLSAARSVGAVDTDLAKRVGDRLVAEFALDSDWQLLLMEFWLRAIRDPSVRKPFAEYRRRLREQVAEEYERIFPAGDPEVEPMQIATAILALSNGIALERLVDSDAAKEPLLGIAIDRVTRAARE